jgi:hypothetical protein
MSGILSGTSVAATAVSAAAIRVYFQDEQGGIREGKYPTPGSPSGWGVSKTPIFTAKLFTPLSVISWDNGQQVSHKPAITTRLIVRFAFIPSQTTTLSRSGPMKEVRGPLAI